MIEKIHQKLSDSKVARWSVLALAAFTMLCGYFLTDVMAPLKPMLEEQLSWITPSRTRLRWKESFSDGRRK